MITSKPNLILASKEVSITNNIRLAGWSREPKREHQIGFLPERQNAPLAPCLVNPPPPHSGLIPSLVPHDFMGDTWPISALSFLFRPSELDPKPIEKANKWVYVSLWSNGAVSIQPKWHSWGKLLNIPTSITIYILVWSTGRSQPWDLPIFPPHQSELLTRHSGIQIQCFIN